MTVYVKCTKCDNEQKSMFQTDSEVTLRNNDFRGNFEPCRKCGVPIVVNNQTVYWK